MKYRDLKKMLVQAGFSEKRHDGTSHRQWSNKKTGRQTVLPGKDGEEVPKGLLSAILRQAGLK